MHSRLWILSLTPIALFTLVAGTCGRTTWTNPHEPVGKDQFTSPQANPLGLSPDGTRLYVANTTSNGISVIDTTTNTKLVTNLRVGIDPVSVAVRPDGDEVWIANHVSDSVSVLDTAPVSSTHLEVIATIQDLDADGVTSFDEPVGIAFASNSKTYVALSSTNEIAGVDIGPGYSVRTSLRGQRRRLPVGPGASRVPGPRAGPGVIESSLGPARSCTS